MFWVLFLLLLLKTVIYDMTTREWLLFLSILNMFMAGPYYFEMKNLAVM
jgi:hypothetical protein